MGVYSKLGSEPSVASKVAFACIAFGAATWSADASAEGFGTFSEHRALVDEVVVAAGNIIKMPRISDSGPGPFSQPKLVVYQIGQFCFASSDGIADKAGLLMIDKFSTVSITTISGEASSIEIKSTGVPLLDCSSVRQQDLSLFKSQVENQRKQADAMIRLMKKSLPHANPAP